MKILAILDISRRYVQEQVFFFFFPSSSFVVVFGAMLQSDELIETTEEEDLDKAEENSQAFTADELKVLESKFAAILVTSSMLVKVCKNFWVHTVCLPNVLIYFVFCFVFTMYCCNT